MSGILSVLSQLILISQCFCNTTYQCNLVNPQEHCKPDDTGGCARCLPAGSNCNTFIYRYKTDIPYAVWCPSGQTGYIAAPAGISCVSAFYCILDTNIGCPPSIDPDDPGQVRCMKSATGYY